MGEHEDGKERLLPGLCTRVDGRRLADQWQNKLSMFLRIKAGCVRNLIVLHGGMRARKRREAAEKLAGVPDDEERLVLATVLSPRTSCSFLYEFSPLSGIESLILRTRSHLYWIDNTDPICQNRTMTIPRRHQQSYDHRLRDLVQKTRDPSIATDLGIPRSIATCWLRESPRPVVTLDVLDMKDIDLQEQVLQLRRRIRKLIVLFRLLHTVLRISGFRLAEQRVPDERSKATLLRAIDRAREFFSLRTVLRISRLSPSRYHSWARSRKKCSLDDSSSCPRTSPHRLTSMEVQTVREMVTSEKYRHVPTGTLAILAQRLGKVFASPASRYKLIRRHGWRRPCHRVHPAKPKVGIRALRPDETWHIDTTIIRLLDGTKAYLHAVIDNFSRRILSWRLADKFDPTNTIAILLDASKGVTTPSDPPTVYTDSGVENVNHDVDELIQSGVLQRVLALTEIHFSNSLIEAWWRSLKHQWLYLNSLDSISTLRRLIVFYIEEHNSRLPHSAFRGQTPDEIDICTSKLATTCP